MPIHPSFQKILSQFTARYGDAEGKKKYSMWLNKLNLDDTKAYSNNQLKKKECLSDKCTHSCAKCLKESFQWAKPLIKLFKQDKEAKYYQVEAHFAVSSMNNNLYTLPEMMDAIHLLPNQHVDLNHNLEWIMQPLEISAAMIEDECAECIIRVPNGSVDAKGRNCQTCFEDGTYHSVSIEADSDGVIATSEGNQIVGLKYTGLAVLDEEALPGIPLTTIQPLEKLVAEAFSLVEQLQKQTESEVKTNMIEANKLKEMSIDDIKTQIANLSKQNAEIDTKLYPPYKQEPAPAQISDEERTKLRAQQTAISAELDAYRQALTAKTLAAAQSEAAASYCPLCGEKLVGGKCPNKECAAYGKSVQMDEEKLQLTRRIADLTEELSTKTIEYTHLQTDLSKTQSQVTDLSEKLAKATRENVKVTIVESHNQNLREKLTNAVSEANEQRGKVEAKANEITKLEERLNKEHAALQRAEESLGKREAELDEKRRELNEESTRRASAEQKALNETKECSRIKLENAGLLEEKARDTRSISDLSTRLSEAAIQHLKTEKELAEAKDAVGKRDEAIKQMQAGNEKAIVEQKRLYKILKENNIYELDKDGNLIVPA
jgi:hypothetical protein